MNLIVSFVVTLVSLTITTINYLKLPLVVGGIVGAIILSFSPAHASTVIEVYQQPSIFSLLIQWLTPVVGFGLGLCIFFILYFMAINKLMVQED